MKTHPPNECEAAVPALVRIFVHEGSRLGQAFEPILSALVEIGDPRAMDGFLHILKTEPKAANFLTIEILRNLRHLRMISETRAGSYEKKTNDKEKS